MKSINWKDHAVNLFVVILGISIAFGLENWRDFSKNKRKEKEYLSAIYSELNNDKVFLDTVLSFDQSRIKMIDKLSTISINSSVSRDSVGYYLAFIQYVPRFTPQSVTYEALKTSGKLELITNFELRKRLISLHNQYYQGQREYDDLLNQHVIQFLRPFVMNNVKYFGPFKVVPDFIDDKRFQNIIFTYRSIYEQKIIFTKLVKEECEEIIELIATETSHL